MLYQEEDQFAYLIDLIALTHPELTFNKASMIVNREHRCMTYTHTHTHTHTHIHVVYKHSTLAADKESVCQKLYSQF